MLGQGRVHWMMRRGRRGEPCEVKEIVYVIDLLQSTTAS
jgi:hypothetical protein